LTQFFKTNDGKAVTLEELLYSISEQSHVDVSNFLPWFTETGIPRLVVTDAYDAETKSYSLSVNCTGTKQRPIPLVIGLIDSSGTEILSDHLLKVDHEQMVFHFNNIASRPTPSLLRSFSAPVTLHYNYTNEALIHLMLHDSNEYNRCEAMHALMENLVKASCEVSKTELSSEFIITYKLLFKDPTLTPWTLAEILSIPAEEDLFSNLSLPDYSQISKARKRIVRAVATALRGEIDECLKHLDQWIGSTSPQFSIFDIHEAGKRKLLKVLYSYLLAIEPNSINKVKQLFYDSLDNNMTNTINALSLLCDLDTKETEDALNAFYVHWQHDTNAINYWLTIQAGSHSSKVVNRVRYLMSHLAFDITNPNKVYALLGTFINNLYGFHNASGKGYEVITDAVLQLDIINPSLAARLTDGFAVWSKHKATQQKMMQKQLQIIYQSAVSFDVKNSAQQALDKT